MALIGWANKIKLQIDNTVIDSDLTNFTVVGVIISASSGKTSEDLTSVFTELGDNLYKIAIEYGDTGTECYVEVEYWSSSSSLAVLHVKSPSVTAATATELNLYYDSTHDDNTTHIGVTGSAVAQNAWDSATYLLNNFRDTPPSAAIDSTVTGHDLTPYGSMDASDLVLAAPGYGWAFNGTSQYALGARTAIAGDITVEAFTKVINQTEYLATNYDSSNDSGWFASNDATGKLGFSGRTKGGSFYSSGLTTSGYSDGNLHYVVGSRIGSTMKIQVDLTDTASAAATSGDISGSANVNTCVGALKDGVNSPTGFAGITISWLRISSGSRSTAWQKATFYSLNDNLITYTLLNGAIISSIDKLYGSGPTGPSGIAQVWGLMHDPATLGLYKLWHIFDGPVSNSVIKLWGFAVESVLNKSYSNAAVAIISLIKRYRDAAIPKTGITIRYDDALAIEVALSKIYHLMHASSSGLSQPYAITEEEVKAALDQLYDLALYNEPINAALSQVYGIIGAYSNITNFNNLSVLASGIAVYPDDIVITEDLSQYLIRAEMVFKSQADYAVIQKNGTVIFNNGTTEYEFFVAEKRRSRSRNGLNGVSNDYIVVCLSWSAALDHPYHLPLSTSWDSAELASDVVKELADDIAVDWQINDWTIPAGTLFANDETPIQIIRKIIRDRGVIQDNPNGKIISIIKEYAISPTRWAESSPVYILSDLDDIETISEYEDERSGVSKIIVSNQLTSDKRLYPREEQINSSTRRVKGYRIPWASTFTIEHSGGSWVSITDDGIITEQITDEFIEFVDGVGRAGQPIYSQPIVKWMENGLGSLAYAEDGTLKAEIVGNSLAEVSYYTKYRSWTVKDNRNEKVQIWLRATEND